jgi:hypothetical protein
MVSFSLFLVELGTWIQKKQHLKSEFKWVRASGFEIWIQNLDPALDSERQK